MPVLEINLAPGRKHQRQRASRLFLVWLVMGWVMIWILFAVAGVRMQQSVNQQSVQRLGLKENIANYQFSLQGFTDSAQANIKILAGVGTLQTLLDSRKGGYEVLLTLAQAMPARARYIEVNFSTDGLTVTGIADSHQVVAQLMSNVYAAGGKSPLQLLSTERRDEKKGSAKIRPLSPTQANPVRFRIYGEDLGASGLGSI